MKAEELVTMDRMEDMREKARVRLCQVGNDNPGAKSQGMKHMIPK